MHNDKVKEIAIQALKFIQEISDNEAFVNKNDGSEIDIEKTLQDLLFDTDSPFLGAKENISLLKNKLK